MATPLDTLKTHLHLGESVGHISRMPIYGRIAGKGSEMVASDSCSADFICSLAHHQLAYPGRISRQLFAIAGISIC